MSIDRQMLSKDREQTEFVLGVMDDFISVRCPYLVVIYLWINFFGRVSTIFDVLTFIPVFNESNEFDDKKLQSKLFDARTFTIEGLYASHYSMERSVIAIILKRTLVYAS